MKRKRCGLCREPMPADDPRAYCIDCRALHSGRLHIGESHNWHSNMKAMQRGLATEFGEDWLRHLDEVAAEARRARHG